MTDAPVEGKRSINARKKRAGLSALREKERQCLVLYTSGATLDVVAAQTGYANASGAWKAIQRALSMYHLPEVEELRKVELSRLDRLLLALWPRALTGDLPAIDRILRIVLIRSDLLGLAAPRRIDVEGLIRAAAIQEGTDPDEAVKIGASLVSNMGTLLQLPARFGS